MTAHGRRWSPDWDSWRSDTPKKADAADYAALVTAVCTAADKAPVK